MTWAINSLSGWVMAMLRKSFIDVNIIRFRSHNLKKIQMNLKPHLLEIVGQIRSSSIARVHCNENTFIHIISVSR